MNPDNSKSLNQMDATEEASDNVKKISSNFLMKDYMQDLETCKNENFDLKVQLYHLEQKYEKYISKQDPDLLQINSQLEKSNYNLKKELETNLGKIKHFEKKIAKPHPEVLLQHQQQILELTKQCETLVKRCDTFKKELKDQNKSNCDLKLLLEEKDNTILTLDLAHKELKDQMKGLHSKIDKGNKLIMGLYDYANNKQHAETSEPQLDISFIEEQINKENSIHSNKGKSQKQTVSELQKVLSEKKQMALLLQKRDEYIASLEQEITKYNGTRQTSHLSSPKEPIDETFALNETNSLVALTNLMNKKNEEIVLYKESVESVSFSAVPPYYQQVIHLFQARLEKLAGFLESMLSSGEFLDTSNLSHHSILEVKKYIDDSRVLSRSITSFHYDLSLVGTPVANISNLVLRDQTFSINNNSSLSKVPNKSELPSSMELEVKYEELVTGKLVQEQQMREHREAVVSLTDRLQNAQQQIHAKEAEGQQLRDKKTALEQEQREAGVKMEKLAENGKQLEKDNRRLQKEVSALKNKLAESSLLSLPHSIQIKTENHNDLLQPQIEGLQREVERLTSLIEQAEGNLADAELTRVSIQSNLVSRMEHLEKALAQKSVELTREAELKNEYYNQLLECNKRLASLKEKATLENEDDSLDSDLDDLKLKEEEIINLSAKVTLLEKELEGSEKEKASLAMDLNLKINNLQSALSEIEEALSTVSQLKDDLAEELKKLQTENENVQLRLESDCHQLTASKDLLENEREALFKELSSLKLQQEELAAQNQDSLENNSKLAEEKDSVQKELSDLQGANDELKLKLEEEIHQRAGLEESFIVIRDSLTSQMVELKNELAEKEESLAKESSLKDNLSNQLEIVVSEQKQFKLKAEELSKKLETEIVEKSENFSQLENVFQAGLQTIETLQTKIDELKQEVTTKQEEHSRHLKEIEGSSKIIRQCQELEAILETKEEDNHRLAELVNEKENSLNLKHNEFSELKTEFIKVKKEAEDLTKSIEVKDKELSGLKSHLQKQLKDSEETYLKEQQQNQADQDLKANLENYKKKCKSLKDTCNQLTQEIKRLKQETEGVDKSNASSKSPPNQSGDFSQFNKGLIPQKVINRELQRRSKESDTVSSMSPSYQESISPLHLSENKAASQSMLSFKNSSLSDFLKSEMGKCLQILQVQLALEAANPHNFDPSTLHNINHTCSILESCLKKLIAPSSSTEPGAQSDLDEPASHQFYQDKIAKLESELEKAQAECRENREKKLKLDKNIVKELKKTHEVLKQTKSNVPK